MLTEKKIGKKCNPQYYRKKSVNLSDVNELCVLCQCTVRYQCEFRSMCRRFHNSAKYYIFFVYILKWGRHHVASKRHIIFTLELQSELLAMSETNNRIHKQ